MIEEKKGLLVDCEMTLPLDVLIDLKKLAQRRNEDLGQTASYCLITKCRELLNADNVTRIASGAAQETISEATGEDKIVPENRD